MSTYINDAADRSLRKVYRLVYHALRESQRAVSVSAIQTACRTQDRQSILTQELIATRVLKRNLVDEDQLSNAILSVVVRGGRAELTHLYPTPPKITQAKEVDFRFDRTNPKAQEWAFNESSKLITDITAEQRAAIRLILGEAFRAEGFPPVITARLVRSAIGLTTAQAEALLAVRLRIIENPGKIVRAGKVRIQVPERGMPVDRMDRVLRTYADRLLKQRAMSIARTETIASANEGQRLLWKELIHKDLLSATALREWIATIGACPTCADLEGSTATIDGLFPGGYSGPPAHTRCRCTQGLVSASRPKRLERPQHAPRPSFGSRPAVTVGDVLEVRRMALAGRALDVIAPELQLDADYVARIARREIWAEVA